MALSENDQRLDRLAPSIVGHPDDGRLGHRRVLVKAVLHLDRADVLAAGDDDVLLPVGYHQVIAILEVALVAGVEPPAGQRALRLLRLPPVPGEDMVGPGQHLAGLVGPDLHAHGWDAGPRLQPRPRARIQAVPLAGHGGRWPRSGSPPPRRGRRRAG